MLKNDENSNENSDVGHTVKSPSLNPYKQNRVFVSSTHRLGCEIREKSSLFYFISLIISFAIIFTILFLSPLIYLNVADIALSLIN